MFVPRTLRVAALLAVATALTATGCGSSDSGGSGKVSLTWSTWGSPEELDRFKEFNKDFMQRHPDIKVTLQAVPSYSEYHAKLLTQLSSNTAPDVFYVGDDNIAKFVSSGRLSPLNELMAAPDSKAKTEDFFDGLYGGAKTKDGQVYGLPNDANPEVLWYDKQALKEAGVTEDPATLNEQGKWTMATFLEMNRKLKGAGKAGSIFYNWYGSTYSMINGFGGKVYDGTDFVATTDLKSREALKTLADGYADKTFLVADNLPEGDGVEPQFIKHKAGFLAGGRYIIDTAKKGGQEANYDIVPFPSQTGAPIPAAVAASFLSLNKDSKHAKEAWTFLSEFVSKEGQTLRLKGGGNAVPSVKGAESVVLEGYPAHAQTFVDTRDKGYANYAQEAGVPGLTAEINDSLMKLWTGKVGFEQEMSDLKALVSTKLI
ncbi:ABC transporter substrate-binding protein [Yinghuangia seranimata]|uniref:ABC transporter substrate-binding protein n=1 Tax=Yinghuangia seranimata TaxID=408067 RepID=UPI00248B7B83|nr:sugar ABC transporter substrate-binding protein [Yinghuangia seranimata]MDI2128469.1 sugar ABC transporter substrate-binding protein [Yinghuangia seranimata]